MARDLSRCQVHLEIGYQRIQIFKITQFFMSSGVRRRLRFSTVDSTFLSVSTSVPKISAKSKF